MDSVASRLRRFLMEGRLRIRAWHARFASLHRVKPPCVFSLYYFSL